MEMFKRFLVDEEGLGTVEIVMLILVLVGLAITFREGITKVVENMVATIEKQMNSK